MSSFLGQPYQIATSSTDKMQLQTEICIDDFPSFVKSKAISETKAGTFDGVNWFIVIDLSKYCQESKRYITLNSTSSDTPEFLGIYFYCESNPNASTSRRFFSIDASIKFKRKIFSNTFYLTRSNQDKRRRYAHPDLSQFQSGNPHTRGFGIKIEVCFILLN